MNSIFQKVFDDLEKQRASVLAEIQQSDSEKLNFHHPGKWSVNQILNHIVTSEKLSVGYMKKKAQGIDNLNNSGIKEKFFLWLMIISQRIPLKYKAPKVVVDKTPPTMPLNQLISEWDSVRKDLADFLQTISDKNSRKLLFKHPVGGRMDASQAMMFFREHIAHHKPQIDRLLKMPDK